MRGVVINTVRISTPVQQINIDKRCNRVLDEREYLVIIRDNVLLILHKNICNYPSSEPSRRDGSDEGSQHMVLMRNKKKYHQILSYLELCL